MRSKMSNTLWGLFFIVLGVGFAGSAFDVWDFHLFFRGWWTLFIIVPCLISIVQNGFNLGSIIGLCIGVLLLLSQQGLLDPQIVGKLIFPVILVMIGLSIIFKNTFQKMDHIEHAKEQADKSDYSAIFSGQNMNFNNQIFTGTTLNSVFGSVNLDLRSAIINEDVLINCSAIFGGIQIYMPEGVNVKTSCTPIFGGIDNKRRNQNIQNAPTVYISGTCMFGGIDIK